MPNSKCAAAFCNNKRAEARKRKLDIVFHAFPSEEALRSKWIQFCKRDAHWTPFKTDAVCSIHFHKHDYQMAHSPRMWGKNLRRLNLNAYPTVTDGSVITISKKQKLDEQISKQLVEELYHNTQPTELATDRDHSYTGVTAEDAMKSTSIVLQQIVYRLQKFPNVCAFCFKAITDEKMFSPFTYYHDELESTIEQKFEEITGLPMDEKDRASLHHLLPDKVCAECLEALITFHQYQRQLECMRKFSTGLAHLLKGNRTPLQDLYEEQGTYLVSVLKSLNICQGSEDKVTLERLEQEVASYGRVKKYTVFEPQDHSIDGFQTVTSVTAQQDLSQRESGDNNRPKKWICPYEAICREWFLDEASLQEHVRDSHKCFKCRTCGEKIKFYDLYKKHIDSHAIARALLLSHNSNQGSTKQEHWRCEICAKVFQSENLLNRHEQIHGVARNYVCGSCLGAYESEDQFNNHTCYPASTSRHPVGQDNSECDAEEDSNSHDCEFSPSSQTKPPTASGELLSIEILQ